MGQFDNDVQRATPARHSVATKPQASGGSYGLWQHHGTATPPPPAFTPCTQTQDAALEAAAKGTDDAVWVSTISTVFPTTVLHPDSYDACRRSWKAD